MGERNYTLMNTVGYFGIPLVLYAVFIFGGFFLVARESLGYVAAFGQTTLHFDHYREVLSEETFIESLGFSLYLAIVSASVSTILGVWIAQYLVFSSNRFVKYLVDKISNVLVILPYLYLIYLMIFSLSETGLLARVLRIFGVPVEVNLLYDSFGIGLILTYVLKGAPFVAIYVYGVMVKIKRDYYVLAESMGVDKRGIINSIYIPLSKNAIIWSSIVLFAYNLGSYEVPMLLSNVQQNTLSQYVYRLYTSSDYMEIPQAMALNIIVLGINIICGIGYALLLDCVIRRRIR